MNYDEYRQHTEERFQSLVPAATPEFQSVSPSGLYTLEVHTYGEPTGERCWDYSRGIITRSASGTIIADIRRNYGSFQYCWIRRGDEEYLVCGEDYQGYNVIDLNRAINVMTFPDAGYAGGGFCWIDVHPSPDGKVLAVEGCIWGGWHEVRMFDFTDPLRSPLPQLAHFEPVDSVQGWDGDRFHFKVFEDDDETPPSEPGSWNNPIK